MGGFDAIWSFLAIWAIRESRSKNLIFATFQIELEESDESWKRYNF